MGHEMLRTPDNNLRKTPEHSGQLQRKWEKARGSGRLEQPQGCPLCSPQLKGFHPLGTGASPAISEASLVSPQRPAPKGADGLAPSQSPALPHLVR